MAAGGQKNRYQDVNQVFTLRWVDQASRNKIPLSREGALANQIVVPRDQKVVSHHRIKASSLKGCLRLTPSDKVRGVETSSISPSTSKQRGSIPSNR